MNLSTVSTPSRPNPCVTIEVDPDGSAVLLVDGEPVLACPTVEAVLTHERSLDFVTGG